MVAKFITIGFLGPKNSKDDKLWSQNMIFFFLKPNCKDMHEDIGARHVGFKGGPPKVAMHAMLERENGSGV